MLKEESLVRVNGKKKGKRKVTERIRESKYTTA
jgi:hypothetical protein